MALLPTPSAGQTLDEINHLLRHQAIDVDASAPSGSMYVNSDGRLRAKAALNVESLIDDDDDYITKKYFDDNQSSGGVANDGSVNPTNILYNGDFEYWYAGTSVCPTRWTESGSGATFAREGTIKKCGSYSVKMVSDADGVAIYQAIHTYKGITYWKGRTLSFSCWVYASDADTARLSITDSTKTEYSSYHTGDSTWQLLTVQITVSTGSPTYINLNLINDGNTKTVYFDGAMAVEGASYFAFIPNPNDQLYDAFSGRPAFSAYSNSEQSNLLNGAQVTFGIEVFDNGGNFASNVFTAPVTGKYLLTFLLRIPTVDSDYTAFQPAIYTSNRTYYTCWSPNKILSSDGYLSCTLSIVADMDANDIAEVELHFTGGATTTDIGQYSYFTGALLT